MPGRRRVVGRIGVAWAGLTLLLGGCAAAGSSTGPQGFVSGTGAVSILAPADRRPAPVVAGTGLDGERLSLGDFAGRVVVLNVWGSWCPPCRAEAPELAAAARRLNGDGVAFLGIDVRDNVATARAFTAAAGIPYPSISDQSGSTLLGFRGTLPPNAIPSTLVIDADGEVAARVLGPVTESTLVGLVRDVVAGP
jgi:thiol-disulfide isomerase/thioredoxin